MMLSALLRKAFVFPLVAGVCLLVAAQSHADDVGRIERFELGDSSGGKHVLAPDQKRVTAIVFLGTECPLAKLYAPRIERLADQFKTEPVQFFAVDANQQDSTKEMAEFTRQHSLTVPFLKDADNRLADALGATRTPEAFVLNEKLEVVYHGRIDDMYGIGFAREEAENAEFADAIDAVLAGASIQQKYVEPVGCLIGRVRTPDKTSQVTWSNQISGILSKHCIECHQPGEIGPFSLTDYDEVVGWGPMIAEVVEEQRMPPWHADPKVGHFSNSRLLSVEDKKLIAKWVKAGCPSGESKAPITLTTKADGWQLNQPPDEDYSMRGRWDQGGQTWQEGKPFLVPAEGTVEYRYFVIDPQFDEEKWIRSAEIVPGNRSVVHHAIVFIRPPDSAGFRGIGWLTAYVPGQRIEKLEPGMARRIPAGSKLVFQMHYTPNGSPQEDLTRIGLWFEEDENVTEEVVTDIAINQSLKIPPHAADHQEEVVANVRESGRLIAIVPHMHVRGKAFRVALQNKQDKPRPLLSVPQYDFNWQTTYHLEEPLRVSAGSKIVCDAVFDNSTGNPNNPDPAQFVRWGDQTWEEMALAYLAIAIPRDGAKDAKEQSNETDAEFESRVTSASKELLNDLDKDGDGTVLPEEVSEGFRNNAFGQTDSNSDGKLTLDELTTRVRKSLKRKEGRRER